MSKVYGTIMLTVTVVDNVRTERFVPLEHNEKRQNISEYQCKIRS